MEQFLSKLLMICLAVMMILGIYFLYWRQRDVRPNRRKKNRQMFYQPRFEGPTSHPRGHQRENVKTKIMPFMILDVQTNQGIRSIPLTDNGSGFMIGSSEKCQLVISRAESEFVGRKHAYIYLDDQSNQYILEDMDSLNGVYCVQENGQVKRVNQIELHQDMQFYIADVLVTIRQNNPFADVFYQTPVNPNMSFDKVSEHFQKV